MADINQIVSLGIGSPAGIQEFLTFGLQIAEVVVVIGGLDGTVVAYPLLAGTVDAEPLLTGTIEVDPG